MAGHLRGEEPHLERHTPVLEGGPAIGLAQQLLVPLLVGRLAAENRPRTVMAQPSSASVSSLIIRRNSLRRGLLSLPLLVFLLQLSRPMNQAAVRAVPLQV